MEDEGLDVCLFAFSRCTFSRLAVAPVHNRLSESCWVLQVPAAAHPRSAEVVRELRVRHPGKRAFLRDALKAHGRREGRDPDSTDHKIWHPCDAYAVYASFEGRRPAAANLYRLASGEDFCGPRRVHGDDVVDLGHVGRLRHDDGTGEPLVRAALLCPPFLYRPRLAPRVLTRNEEECAQEESAVERYCMKTCGPVKG